MNNSGEANRIQKAIETALRQEKKRNTSNKASIVLKPKVSTVSKNV